MRAAIQASSNMLTTAAAVLMINRIKNGFIFTFNITVTVSVNQKPKLTHHPRPHSNIGITTHSGASMPGSSLGAPGVSRAEVELSPRRISMLAAAQWPITSWR